MTALTALAVSQYCKPGYGAFTCRFLMNDGAWRCAKERPEAKAAIERRRKSMTAKGDNCSGPPDFTIFEQDATL